MGQGQHGTLLVGSEATPRARRAAGRPPCGLAGKGQQPLPADNRALCPRVCSACLQTACKQMTGEWRGEADNWSRMYEKRCANVLRIRGACGWQRKEKVGEVERIILLSPSAQCRAVQRTCPRHWEALEGRATFGRARRSELGGQGWVTQASVRQCAARAQTRGDSRVSTRGNACRKLEGMATC